MPYKAIIFDMDGTIIETEHIWRQARNFLITSRGITLTPDMDQELAQRCAGRSMRDCCTIIKDIANIPDSIDTLIREKHELSCSLYEHHVRFIHGFADFHNKTVIRQLKTAVATNANDQTVRITNKKLNLEQFFGEHIYNISHVFMNGKPHPAIYLHAAEKLEIEPANCIAIEDSASGIQAAKSAGMFCIGINTAKKPELLHAADMIINAYHEINLESLCSR